MPSAWGKQVINDSLTIPFNLPSNNSFFYSYFFFLYSYFAYKDFISLFIYYFEAFKGVVFDISY